jgi:hypothetical protein
MLRQDQRAKTGQERRELSQMEQLARHRLEKIALEMLEQSCTQMGPLQRARSLEHHQPAPRKVLEIGQQAKKEHMKRELGWTEHPQQGQMEVDQLKGCLQLVLIKVPGRKS